MKIETRIRLAAFLLSAVITAGFTACGQPAEPAAAPSGASSGASSGVTSGGTYKYGKIDIPGKGGSLCAAPTYIAYEKGFFAEEGFDVNLIAADTETTKIDLNNGTIPIVNGDFQFFPSIEQGVNVKVVDGLHKGCIKLVVNPDSDIQTATDLKGKKIGVDEIGGTPHQVASVWLEQAGISALPEDHQVTFLPFSDGNLELEALYSGQIDVAAMWDPLASVAEKAGKVKVILDIGTDPPFAGKYCCFLYASSKVIDENPAEISALLRAYHKAEDWIAANPAEAVDIIINGKYSDIEDKELAEQLITCYDYSGSHDPAGGDDSVTMSGGSTQMSMGGDDATASGDPVRDNILYFAQQLYAIGYLKTDPEAFTNLAYYKADLSLGAQSESSTSQGGES